MANNNLIDMKTYMCLEMYICAYNLWTLAQNLTHTYTHTQIRTHKNYILDGVRQSHKTWKPVIKHFSRPQTRGDLHALMVSQPQIIRTTIWDLSTLQNPITLDAGVFL